MIYSLLCTFQFKCDSLYFYTYKNYVRVIYSLKLISHMNLLVVIYVKLYSCPIYGFNLFIFNNYFGKEFSIESKMNVFSK